MNQLSDFEIIEYIERPENNNLTRFFRSVKKYHDFYSLESLLPIMNLLLLFKKWNEYLDKESAVAQTCELVLSEMNYLDYNDFEQFIILDFLIKFIDKIEYKQSSNDRKDEYVERFKMHQTVISHRIHNYSMEERAQFVKKLESKPPHQEIDLLRIYNNLYIRIVDVKLLKVNYFAQLVENRRKELHKAFGNGKRINNEGSIPLNVSNADLKIMPKPNIEQEHNYYADDEKLYIKDLTKVLKYSDSQVRRLILRVKNPIPMYRDSPKGKMYFFYPEIMDWLKSNKQKSSLQEAGEVFRRKSKGTGKTRRPRLK